MHDQPESSIPPEGRYAGQEEHPWASPEDIQFVQGLNIPPVVLSPGTHPRPVLEGAEIAIQADRLLARIRDYETEMLEIHAIASARIADIQRWQGEQVASRARGIDYLKNVLHLIALAYDFGKRKSKSLPNGKFGFRSVTPTVEILDEAAAVAFAETMELEVKKSIGKTPLIAWVQERLAAGWKYDAAEDGLIDPETGAVHELRPYGFIWQDEQPNEGRGKFFAVSLPVRKNGE